jgi:hypothetical protein
MKRHVGHAARISKQWNNLAEAVSDHENDI